MNLEPLTQATPQEFDEKFPVHSPNGSNVHRAARHAILQELTPLQATAIKAFTAEKERAAYLAGIRHIAEKVKEEVEKHSSQSHYMDEAYISRNDVEAILDYFIHQELSQVEKTNEVK